MLSLCGAEHLKRLLIRGGGAAAGGGSLLHVAVAHGQHETLCSLLAVARRHDNDSGEELHAALLQSGDAHNDTPLHVAARRGVDDPCVLSLLEAGADHGALNARGAAALPASEWGSAAPAVVEALLRAASRQPAPLTLLSLAATDLRTLPDAFFTLTQLAIVDLSLNFLVELPASVSRLTGLQELYLGYNQLVTLPQAALRSLTRLTVLDVKGNPLDVTARITAAAVVRSKTLEIEGVPMRALPLTLLESVPQLEQLLVRACGLQDVARLVTPHSNQPLLPHLSMLNLSRNVIFKLPPRALVECAATLTLLDLSDNRLVALPRSIAQLTALQRLNVASNLLKFFPHIVILIFYFLKKKQN